MKYGGQSNLADTFAIKLAMCVDSHTLPAYGIPKESA